MINIDFVKALLDIGSIAGLFSFVYTVSEHKKKAPKFSFDFRSSSRRTYEKDTRRFAKLTWEGTIKNESLTENSIVGFYYIIWANKSRTRYKTMGMIDSIQDLNTKEVCSLPINFKPRESKNIILSADTTTIHISFFKPRKPVPPGSIATRPEPVWNLAFKDVGHNFFDEKGVLRSEKLIELWSYLPSTARTSKNRKVFSVLRAYSNIFITWTEYQVKSFFRALGL